MSSKPAFAKSKALTKQLWVKDEIVIEPPPASQLQSGLWPHAGQRGSLKMLKIEVKVRHYLNAWKMGHDFGIQVHVFFLTLQWLSGVVVIDTPARRARSGPPGKGATVHLQASWCPQGCPGQPRCLGTHMLLLELAPWGPQRCRHDTAAAQEWHASQKPEHKWGSLRSSRMPRVSLQDSLL